MSQNIHIFELFCFICLKKFTCFELFCFYTFQKVHIFELFCFIRFKRLVYFANYCIMDIDNDNIILLPKSNGIKSSVLINDGSGNLSWEILAGSHGVKFNQSLDKHNKVEFRGLKIQNDLNVGGKINGISVSEMNQRIQDIEEQCKDNSWLVDSEFEVGSLRVHDNLINGVDIIKLRNDFNNCISQQLNHSSHVFFRSLTLQQNTGTIRFKAPAIVEPYDLTWPDSQSTQPAFLFNNKYGELSWYDFKQLKNDVKPFDQSLNTNDNVTFNNIIVSHKINNVDIVELNKKTQEHSLSLIHI